MAAEENEIIPQEVQDIGLDEYFEPKRFGSKFWLSVSLIIITIGFILFYKFGVIDQSITGEELKSSIEFFDINSQWVVKQKIDTDEFKGVILVPQISFRVRNIGSQDLKNVFLLGVFSFLDTGKTIGEGYEMILKDGLPPEGESRRVTLTSGFGYRATSERAFDKNQKDWRTTFVEIFARSRNSKLTFVKSFYISRKIEGLDIEVRL